MEQILGDIYNQPENVTHTMQEVLKNQHIDELNTSLGLKDHAKTLKYAQDRKKKKLMMLNEMIIENNRAVKEHVNQFTVHADRHKNERLMRGSIGRINKFIGPQVAELHDLKNQETVKKIQATRHKVDLER